MRAVAIIGGGYTGASLAIHLSRTAPAPVKILLIDPSPAPGLGLAYGTQDVDHRLNGPHLAHVFYPHDPAHFCRWLEEQGNSESDPHAKVGGQAVFARRSVFGTYVRAQLAAHQKQNPSNSLIEHIQQPALDICQTASGYDVVLDGGVVCVDMCAIATGHEPPTLPTSLLRLNAHPRVISQPFRYDALSDIDATQRVLILGTGLTAVDIATTLIQRHHRGTITCVSRSGRLPQTHHFGPQTTHTASDVHPSISIWQEITGDNPEFVNRHGSLRTVKEILAALRNDIVHKDPHWTTSFDNLRNAAHVVWPSLPVQEKQRFFRHLKRRYDVHRYRFAPQTWQIVDHAIQTGKLTVCAGHLSVTAQKRSHDGEIRLSIASRQNTSVSHLDVDVLINCSGPDRSVRRSTNPIMRALLKNNLVAPSKTGVGLAINAFSQSLTPTCQKNHEELDSEIVANPQLYIFGPLASGELGETINGPFITRQIMQALPSMLEELFNQE